MSHLPSLIPPLIVGAIAWTTVVLTHAALPLQTFEALLPGQAPAAPWYSIGSPLPSVTDSDSATGEHALIIPGPTGSAPVETTIPAFVLGDNPAFIDLWLKPVARTLALHPAGHPDAGQPIESTGALYLDGAHFLFQRLANRFTLLTRTRSSNGDRAWETLGGFAGTPIDFELEDTGGRAKDWIRLTLRRDVTSGIFDVWVNNRLVAINCALDRISGHPEFRLTHRASSTATDGPLAAMMLDDIQSGPQHPLYPDTDRDGMPDLWEAAFETSIHTTLTISIDVITPDRWADIDLDSVPKITEYLFGSRPNHSDSDGDGIPDGVEITHGLHPASPLDAALDKDGDGFSNLAEYQGQGNGHISEPPTGALTNVVYVKADHLGEQNGQYNTPYRTLAAAVASPYLTSGGRIVIRGEGGPLYHYAPNSNNPAGNSNLTISRPVTLIGVNLAQVHLQETTHFATVQIPNASASPVFICENITFDSCWSDDGGAFRIVGTPGEVIIRNCRFVWCTASDDGGALFAHAARLLVEDCWFDSCLAVGEGGALHLEAGSRATIRRSSFQDTSSGTDGGAVSLRGATTVPIILENCVITRSRARRGSALAAVDGADAIVRQCTVTSGTGTLAGTGAALFGASTASLLTVSGSILWQNTAATTPHAHLSSGASTVTYSTLSGWTTATGPAGTGNNGIDPAFRAHSLLPTAAAMIDSSHPNHNTLTDFLNNPRWDAPGGISGTLADRGAFERQPDTDADGLSDDFEVRYSLNPHDASDADADADQDGYSNYEEFLDKTDPRNATSVKAPAIFVHASAGKDWHPGPNPPAGTLTPSLQGTRTHPFQSIRRAILACPTNRRIVLHDGTYTGPRNINIKTTESWSWVPHLATTSLTSPLSLHSKTIRGLNGPSRTTLDAGGASRHFDLNLVAAGVGQSVTLHNLSLRRGTGDVGGSIKAHGSPGLGYLALHACHLSANRATTAGGALHITGASLNLTKCSLYGNDAPRGGAVELSHLAPIGASSISTASFNQCRFAYNLAFAINNGQGQGGALSVLASPFSTHQTRCDFNHAERHGGAIAILSACSYYPPSLGTGSHFESNSATLRGGALYSENTSFTATATTFAFNRAGAYAATTGEGGAIFFAHPSTTTTTSGSSSSRIPQLTSTRFLGNRAGRRGGAVAIADCSPVFTNCAFVENTAHPVAGHAGAAAVFWESPAALSTTTPSHPSAPRFIHSTFARNQAALAPSLHAVPLTTPWLINCLCHDGFSPPPTPSLVGPRHLYGSHLASPDSLLSPTEADPARRNAFTPVTLAFDWIHRASPARTPNDTTLTTGGIEPSASITFTRPATDIDGEARPPAASGKFTLMPGCDEPRDSDADTLPDWFESLAIAYSPLDHITSLPHTHPVNPSTPTLPNANPTNNADADAYSLTQELLNGGRPDSPESRFEGRDSDADGLSDIFERLTSGLNWTNPDVNNDGVPDGWAYRHFNSITFNPSADDDGDGLSNGLEATLNTNPRSSDTDNDGVPDAYEVATSSDPTNADSNQDGQPDTWATLPLDAHGTTAPGFHQPTPTAPWYVETSWSYFHYHPGSYFYPTDLFSYTHFGIDTLNQHSDYLMQPVRPIPQTPNINQHDYCEFLPNLLGPRVHFLYANEFRHSMVAARNIQTDNTSAPFFPLTDPFESLPREFTALIGQPQTPEWNRQWFHHMETNHRGGSMSWNVGRARQRWLPHNHHQHIQHSILRIVPSFRLRCTLPTGAPENVSLTFLRLRGSAAQTTGFYSYYSPAHHTYPNAENTVSIEPVTLTLNQGQTTGPILTLNPHHTTPLASSPPTIPYAHTITEYFDLIQIDTLLPFDIIAHQRGTLNSPGPRAPTGFGAYGQEVTVLENGDFESSADQQLPDYQMIAAVDSYRAEKDNDLIKLTIRWPEGISASLNKLSLTSNGAQFPPPLDGIRQDPNISGPGKLGFFTTAGVRLLSPLDGNTNILSINEGLLTTLVNSGRLDLFSEGLSRFGCIDPFLIPRQGEYSRETLAEASASSELSGGAILQLKATVNESSSSCNVAVYKGGFWRFQVPNVTTPIDTAGVMGQLQFWDGKGRIDKNATDYGNLLRSFPAKSGIRNGGHYTRAGRGGHVPPGWYFTYRRNDLNVRQLDRRTNLKNRTIIHQGSYGRWKQDDADQYKRYTHQYTYDSKHTKDREIGEPTAVHFKWQLHPIPPNNASGRTQLQIHPDGVRNGTMGCIGIQTYTDCLRVDEMLTYYHQTKLIVEIPN